MRLAVLLALILFSATPATGTNSPQLPAPYAALFDKGHSWTYGFEIVASNPEYEEGKGKRTTTTVFKRTCKVTNVTRVGPALVSQVACKSMTRARGPKLPSNAADDAGVPTWTKRVPPHGVYLATDRGLYVLATLPKAADLREITRRPPQLAAVPRKGTVLVHHDKQGCSKLSYRTSRQRVTVPAGTLHAWRVEDLEEGDCGDRCHEVWYFGDGRGPVLIEFSIETDVFGSSGRLRLVSSSAKN